jgi:hypothetical protein
VTTFLGVRRLDRQAAAVSTLRSQHHAGHADRARSDPAQMCRTRAARIGIPCIGPRRVLLRNAGGICLRSQTAQNSPPSGYQSPATAGMSTTAHGPLAAPSWALDFIDLPTGWHLRRQGVINTGYQCSQCRPGAAGDSPTVAPSR